ncbi:hypothetical protein SGFS_076290 [Streptomyces graminofaciens]|uniref:Lipoprotein n=1 Tax=Streptomyces graminofaciens TaxID=68212 RepID=A0ABM7FGW7_9ACTN|nr:hypothetical protein [Streptomyces graminofaciens]BBC36335.1 hypothetical protein SGFS_076290 [Streptomyces graminofaciens]
MILRRPGRAAVLAAACLAVALSSGCSGKDEAGSGRSATAPGNATSAHPKSTPEATRRAENVEGESVTEAPQLIDGEIVTSVTDVRGSQAVEIKGGVRPGAVGIAVNCRGEGTLTVELHPVGLSFPLKCVAGEISSTYNQIDLKKAREEAWLQVTAGSGVRWALSVGQ